MVCFPPCKINLGLQILSKRSDGYHNISTCFYPVQWTDVLEILPAGDFSFSQTGIAIPGKPEENLCVKAYRLLKNDFNFLEIQVHLHKVIPPGAGLGAGSSDAAYTLTAINTVSGLGLSEGQLLAYAKTLGSDCPFFIRSEPSIGTGRGDELTPLKLDLTNHFIIIVQPGIHVSTADAYAGVIPGSYDVRISDVLMQPVETWRFQLQNDFEPMMFARHPALRELRDELYRDGALYAAMSGSGSSVFGIFRKEISAHKYFKAGVSWSGWL